MRTILEYLEQSGALYADSTAVIDETSEMTYEAFIRCSKRIGSAVAPRISKNEPVAILAEKSAVTLATMFGVVYAGGFYVSINPEQPAERVSKILKVLESKIVIVDSDRRELLQASGFTGTVLAMEDLPNTEIDEAILAKVRENADENDPLYGIFTSGSTGDPKGIIVSHKSVSDFIGHFTEIFGITHDDIMGNQAPFDFDVSVKDIYSTIYTGATIVLIPREYFSTPPRLLDYICDNKVTVLVWAVSALCIISGLKGLRYRVPENIRTIMFSGEVMPIKHLQMWQEALPNTEFVNLYGPSEITCNCTYYRIDRKFEKTDKLPIGKAFPGRTVFLLDDNNQIVTKEGERGELCSAGESLAIGYYNNPEQTAKAFIEYPLEGNVQRVYRTGDLAYIGEDGNFYFAGRGDFQIKHMGHRIELEEVETNLTALPGVDRACCFYDEAKSRIIAYYKGDLSSKEIRAQLKAKIPNYMVPNRFNQVEEMPLNKNGKIDRAYFRNLLNS